MIKLIASDIDGTLVKDGTNVLNPEIYEVILKLKERGILEREGATKRGRWIINILH